MIFGLLAGFAGCGDDAAPADDSASSGTDTGAATDGAGTDHTETEAAEETVGGLCAGTWSAAEFEANAADALALRAQLDLLTGDETMRGAETGAVTVDSVAVLTEIWDGTPSLAAISNPGYRPIVEAALGEFVAVIAAGSVDLTDDAGLWTPGPDGGLWSESNRGLNEGGVEVRQLVDKGGFSGGILYAYAAGLTGGEITGATIDAIAAAWGANAELDADGDLTDAAGYGFQMGFFGEMADALADAKAAAEKPECEAERDTALVAFFAGWEQSMLARTVFYASRAQSNLLTATTDDELADVLHDVGEGLGVAAGFIGLPDPGAGPLADGARIITDAQVREVTGALGLNLDDLGASTTGLFVQSLPELEAAVASVEASVMATYGVDEATIAGYREPTPG